MDASPPALDLAPVLVVLPGGRCALADGFGAREIDVGEARGAFAGGPVLLVHASLTAQRLGLRPPPRSPRLFDVLELWAFARPAEFSAPSPAGLALAAQLPSPQTVAEKAAAVRAVAALLLGELTAGPKPSREEALAQAETLGRAGWPWAPLVVGALHSAPIRRPWRGAGLDAWARLAEWSDEAPAGEAGASPLDSEAIRARLGALLERSGLNETRAVQEEFAVGAAHAFQPREREGEPMMMLAEAGTGVGKTLAYLAPASLWAEANGPGAWISTFTRALQRQIERESQAIFPEAEERARRAVVRKGRENYVCLLNFQEAANAALLGGGDLVGVTLAARWIRATSDGDMTGGDFPAWLPGLFAISPQAQASAANLVDRRGECTHAACPHYRVCFIEKTVRASRRANLVIANHALVMSQAAFDGARPVRTGSEEGEASGLRRIVFDEGHHLFDAADAAFSAELSGAEAAEMRRWIRGPEGRGRRGRGLEARLGDLVHEHDAAHAALAEAVNAARALPAEGWSGRIAPDAGEPLPFGPIETFLAAVIDQLRARATRSEISMECDARPASEAVQRAAGDAAAAIDAVQTPLLALARHLGDLLDEASESLGPAERARIDGALRGLDRRARMTLPAWRTMLAAIDQNAEADPDFVDWFEASFFFGRVVDAACRRHWVDPTEPLAETVLSRTHGVLVTSATLTDPTRSDPFAVAEMRSGAARLPAPPRTLRLASPFDYASNARALVVTDVARDDPRQVAAAMRELFVAAGGGALGLFTAIRRLRACYEHMAPALAARGLELYAQHVDALDVGALIDIFRIEVDACLLGVDAVRDGVDVPGRSLRLLVFDRVPWPRPDILHKARRDRFGGRTYDDAVARARIAQAFGRLIRRADDRGVFVMLDAAAPSRLFASLPEGAAIERVGLVEAIETVRSHLGGAAAASLAKPSAKGA